MVEWKLRVKIDKTRKSQNRINEWKWRKQHGIFMGDVHRMFYGTRFNLFNLMLTFMHIPPEWSNARDRYIEIGKPIAMMMLSTLCILRTMLKWDFIYFHTEIHQRKCFAIIFFSLSIIHISSTSFFHSMWLEFNKGLKLVPFEID